MHSVYNVDANYIVECTMVVSNSDYCGFLNKCESLITTIKNYIEFADHLSSFLSVEENDEDGNITKLVPMSREHFRTLKSTSSQISSYAGRLSSLLSKNERMIDSVAR